MSNPLEVFLPIINNIQRRLNTLNTNILLKRTSTTIHISTTLAPTAPYQLIINSCNHKSLKLT